MRVRKSRGGSWDGWQTWQSFDIDSLSHLLLARINKISDKRVFTSVVALRDTTSLQLVLVRMLTVDSTLLELGHPRGLELLKHFLRDPCIEEVLFDVLDDLLNHFVVKILSDL